ncbi:hypothetical protein [Pedobacter sp. SYP-B3415]|uniref:hypothetical protein n=1 Tax=Pedobacter sp. SYP-B3415 TaxID=2496641 RepID=UPI00101BCBDC|nr:hypothetical protein [Pedobacter sp. SYP-B3415]
MNLDQTFDEEPANWGLRGDPHLWHELKTLVRDEHGINTGEKFLAFLTLSIEKIIGRQLAEGEYPYVKRFDSGGMSGGRISGKFWLNTALPLLVQRFDRLLTDK